MIIRGPAPLRLPAFPPVARRNKRPPKKSGNMFPAKLAGKDVHIPIPAPIPQAGPTFEQLQELAESIGRAIAENITLKVPAAQTYQAKGQITSVREAPTDIHIDIDESIIDVGIGETKQLAKGKHSAKIKKEKAESDNIAASLAKLKKHKQK